LKELTHCIHLLGHKEYSKVQYSTVQYSTVQYSTAQCSAVQYSTVLSSKMYTQFNDQSQCFLQKHTGVFYIIRILIPLIGISFFVTGKASYCVRRDILPQNMTYYHKKRHITTKHDTLSQKTHYHKSDILPQNMTHYHNT